MENMLSHNRPKKGITLTKEVYRTKCFTIRWRQAITNGGEIIDIGAFQIKPYHKGKCNG